MIVLLQKVQHDHPINKISFITHDPEDKRIFGYVCSQACTTGHKLYAIKSEKPVSILLCSVWGSRQGGARKGRELKRKGK